jgi:serpin B
VKTALIPVMAVLLAAPGGTAWAASDPQVSAAAWPALVRGANAFAFDLYARLASRPGNLFFSPFSVHSAMAMAYAGARGSTARAIALAMRYPEAPQQLGPVYGALVGSIADQPWPSGWKPAVELHVANALWGQAGLPFEAGFTGGLARDYGAGLHAVDFAQSGAARDTINRWVADETRGRIQEIVPPGGVGPGILLVLTNAIYFRGVWDAKFTKEQTRPADFRLLNGERVQVPTMHRLLGADYLETAEIQAVRLPYADRKTSLVILLPKRGAGLASLEQRLAAARVSGWLAELKSRPVEVFVPRFTFTDSFDLGSTLAAMGMGEALGRGANFSGIARADGVAISGVFHKTFLAVDEEGTEAAGATAVVLAGMSPARPEPPPPVVFRADHPFLFLIRHDPTGTILFLGRVTDPR